MGKKLGQYVSTEEDSDVLSIDERIVELNHEPASKILEAGIPEGVQEALETISDVLDSANIVNGENNDLPEAIQNLSAISVENISKRLKLTRINRTALENEGKSTKRIAVENFMDVVHRVFEMIRKALKKLFAAFAGIFDQAVNKKLEVRAKCAEAEVGDLKDRVEKSLLEEPVTDICTDDLFVSAFADLGPVVKMQELQAHITSLRVNDGKLTQDLKNLYSAILLMNESLENLKLARSNEDRLMAAEKLVAVSKTAMENYFGDKQALYPAYSKSDLYIKDLQERFDVDLHKFVDGIQVGGMFDSGRCLVVMTEKETGIVKSFFPVFMKEHGKECELHELGMENLQTHTALLLSASDLFANNSVDFRQSNSVSARLLGDMLEYVSNLAAVSAKNGDTEFAQKLTDISYLIFGATSYELGAICQARSSIHRAINNHLAYVEHLTHKYSKK